MKEHWLASRNADASQYLANECSAAAGNTATGGLA
jgi:hypothetical protein